MNKSKTKKIILMLIMVLAISFSEVVTFAATYITGYQVFFPTFTGIATTQEGQTIAVTRGTLSAINYSASDSTSRMSVTLYTSSGTSKGTKYINTNNGSIEELKTTLVWNDLSYGQYYLKYSISSGADQWYVDTTLLDGVN